MNYTVSLIAPWQRQGLNVLKNMTQATYIPSFVAAKAALKLKIRFHGRVSQHFRTCEIG